MSELAQRVASRYLNKTADDNPLWHILDKQKFMKLYRELDKEGDAQSAELLREATYTLADIMRLKDNQARALNRLRNSLDNAGRWKPDMQRNNIFKAANLLGMKLPSAMFA